MSENVALDIHQPAESVLSGAGTPLTNAIRRHPMPAFFCLAYAITWSAAALVDISLAFPLLGLFGPAAAGLLVAWATEGRQAVAEILGQLKVWRVGMRWHIVVVALPSAVVIGASLLNAAFGDPLPAELGEISPLMALIGVMVVGEEIGWRGFALPRMLKTHSALVASITLGLLWSAWHIPNFVFLDESSAYGRSFIAYCVWVVPLAVLMTWVWIHTKSSILIATVFHASANIAGPVFGSTLEVQEAWLLEGALMVLIVAGLVWRLGASLGRDHRGRRSTAADAAPAR